LEGKMIDFGKQEEVDTVVLIQELLEFIDDVVDELDSRDEIEFVKEILKMKTGAYRQLQVFKNTNDLKKVVDFIIEETNLGLNL
ncbi:MAG: carboxylate-amine ligase, partial [Ignavibacteria bacterium]|nr:carboxylate-amine ligase [Ignavibacteria bacterium]